MRSAATLHASSAANTSIVKLNVGGTKFMTTEATLLSRGAENLFGVLLKGPCARDEEGAIFIDRDPVYFGVLLSFLRTGELDVPPQMSRRLLEREALFYLIDLSGTGGRVLTNPLTMTSTSLAGMQHADLRHDGVYLQRHPATGTFVGYYRFDRTQQVTYRSINNATANDLVYCRPARFSRLAHPWLIMHWGSPQQPSKMVASIQPHGLTVEWRYPPRPEHRRPLALHYYSSVEPLLGVLFSDELHRASSLLHLRLFFSDRQRVSISVVERSGHVQVRHTADYSVATRDGLCFVTIDCPLLEMELLALGGILVELSCQSRRDSLDLSARAVRVLVAVSTESEPLAQPERDEIDIYEFLRTYHPPAEDDSSELAPSEDAVQLDEPYLLVPQHTPRLPRPRLSRDPAIDL